MLCLLLFPSALLSLDLSGVFPHAAVGLPGRQPHLTPSSSMQPGEGFVRCTKRHIYCLESGDIEWFVLPP